MLTLGAGGSAALPAPVPVNMTFDAMCKKVEARDLV
jgi:hypothetical protein